MRLPHTALLRIRPPLFRAHAGLGFRWTGASISPTRPGTRLKHKGNQVLKCNCLFDIVRTDDATAVRQLEQIYNSRTLELPPKQGLYAERVARVPKPDESVFFTTPTPWHDYARCAPNDAEGADYARVCVKKFHEENRQKPAKDAHIEIRAVGLGRQILDWMMEGPFALRDSCGGDFSVLYFLAHYIIAEGQEEYFWRVLRAATMLEALPSEPGARTALRIQYGWAARLIGNLGQIHVARDTGGSADNAIRTRAALQKLTFDQTAARTISDSALRMRIRAALWKPGSNTSATNSVLYDWFVENCIYAPVTTEGGGLASSWTLESAYADLFHPTHPDPDPLLRLFRDETVRKVYREQSTEDLKFRYALMRDLRHALNRQGRLRDVAFVNDCRRSLKVRLPRLDEQEAHHESQVQRSEEPEESETKSSLETRPSDLLYMRINRKLGTRASAPGPPQASCLTYSSVDCFVRLDKTESVSTN